MVNTVHGHNFIDFTSMSIVSAHSGVVSVLGCEFAMAEMSEISMM
jgi:hypothetical protein